MGSPRLRCRVYALAVLACAVFPLGACTFPDVDYAETAASDASPTGGCSAPPTCAAAATKCGDDARKTHDACTHGCMNKPGCLPGCDTDFSIALGQCNETCKSCAAGQGCNDATASCKGLVGG